VKALPDALLLLCTTLPAMTGGSDPGCAQLAGQGRKRKWAMEALSIMASRGINTGTIAEVAGQFDRTGRMCYDHFVG
jgi:hypothetical protein